MNVPYTGVLDGGMLCWSKQNPHYCGEVEHHPPHVMLWGAMNSEHLFRPYFFIGLVNYRNYLAMLENRLIVQLQSLGIESNVWFQQDGALAHFAITVREYLKEVFLSRWIGHESAILPAPLNWPPRSHDLTVCGNSLWGFIKEMLHSSATRTMMKKHALTDAFNEVVPQMHRRMSDKTWRRFNTIMRQKQTQ